MIFNSFYFRFILNFIIVLIYYFVLIENNNFSLKYKYHIIFFLIINLSVESLFLSNTFFKKSIFLFIFIFILVLFVKRKSKFYNYNFKIIINRGVINFFNLNECDLSIEDLKKIIYNYGIDSLNKVNFLIVYHNRILISEMDENHFNPVFIIINGKICEDGLLQIEKNSIWLNNIIYNEGYCLEDIDFCFYYNEKIKFVLKK